MNKLKKAIAIVLTSTFVMTACADRGNRDNPTQPNQKGGGKRPTSEATYTPHWAE